MAFVVFQRSEQLLSVQREYIVVRDDHDAFSLEDFGDIRAGADTHLDVEKRQMERRYSAII